RVRSMLMSGRTNPLRNRRSQWPSSVAALWMRRGGGSAAGGRDGGAAGAAVLRGEGLGRWTVGGALGASGDFGFGNGSTVAATFFHSTVSSGASRRAIAASTRRDQPRDAGARQQDQRRSARRHAAGDRARLVA